MRIVFDMDGTLCDTYGVENWLDKLHAEDVTPYLECEPLVDMNELNELLSALRGLGHIIEIISWTSKNGSREYNKMVRNAKIEWLMNMGIIDNFDHIHVVKYGTNKNCVEKISEGIIFDDDARVREKWTCGEAFDPTEINICDCLRELLEFEEE